MSKEKNTDTLVLAQLAWVIKDIEKTKLFFQKFIGITKFSPTVITRLEEFAGTYYDQSSKAENHVSMAYANGTFYELIQPISGESIFMDFINQNPDGGMQHIAYRTHISNLDKVISHYETNGFRIVSSFDTPIAKIVFFDTREEIGVFTEIMGITDEGEIIVEKMKIDLS